MSVKIHSHAIERMRERGVTENEVIKTVEEGENFPVKFGRVGFRRNFVFRGSWRGRQYGTKQVEAYVVKEGEDLIVITVVAKYF